MNTSDPTSNSRDLALGWTGRVAGALVTRPALCLLLLFLSVAASLAGAARLQVDMSPEVFYRESAERLQQWREHEAQWGAEPSPVMVVAHRDRGSILEAEALEAIASMGRELEALPSVAEVARISELAQQRPERFVPQLLSEDHQTSALSVAPRASGASIKDVRAHVDAIRGVVDAFEGRAGLRFELAGLPAVRASFVEASIANQSRLVPLALLAIALVLLIAFRSVYGVVVPIAGAFVPAVFLAGMLGWVGEPIGLLNQVYFTFIPALAIADAVHLLQRYQEELRHEPALGRGNRRAAVVRAISAVGRACFLTSLTSATAFFALCAAETPVVRSFGLWAGVGVVGAYLSFVLWLPPLLVWSGRRVSARAASGVPMGDPGRFTAGKLIVTGLLCLLGWVGGGELEIDGRVTGTLDPTHEVMRGGARVDAELGGVLPLDLHIPADSSADPLELRDRLARHSGVRWAGVESKDGRVRVRLGVKDEGVRAFQAMREDIEAELAASTPASERAPYLVGQGVVSYDAIDTVVTDLRGGMALILAGVVAATLFVVGFGRLFFAAAFVNFIPLLLGGGFMSLMGWDLDVGSVVIFSIAVGITVDDTIHLLERYREERDAGLDPRPAMTRALRGSGRAITVTTAALALGFGLQTFASIPQLVVIGGLGAVLVVVAMLADLIALPAAVLWLEDESVGRMAGAETSARRAI